MLSPHGPHGAHTFPFASLCPCFAAILCCMIRPAVPGAPAALTPYAIGTISLLPDLPPVRSCLCGTSRTTLCSAPMVDFMEHNVLVWGGSLIHGEAYAVGNALDACAFPYVGLLLCTNNQVKVRTSTTCYMFVVQGWALRGEVHD